MNSWRRLRWGRTLAVGWLLATMPGVVTAAEAGRAGAAGNGVVQAMETQQVVQTVFALLLVIAIILVLAAVLRRLNTAPGRSSGPLRVIHAIPVGGKDRLMLVEIGGEQILIGVSPGQVRKVHELRQPLATAPTENDTGAAGRFSGVLGRYLQ